MARAMLIQISDVQQSNPPNITWAIELIFVGSDVPGGFRRDSITFDTAISVTVAGLAAAAVSAIQARGTALGFTVLTGNTLIPSYVAQ